MEEEEFINVPESEEERWYASEVMKATKEIIEDKTVEERLGKNFPLWSLMTKSLKLTFLEERDVAILENLFEAEVCKMLRSIPPSMHNSQLYLQIGQARMIFLANMRRALGTNNRSKINERIALLSQIRQVISSQTETGKRGFLKRLFGLR